MQIRKQLNPKTAQYLLKTAQSQKGNTMTKPMKFFAKDFKIIEVPSEHQLPIMVFKVYRRKSRSYVGRIGIHSANIESLQNILAGADSKGVYNFKKLNRKCHAVQAHVKSLRNS